MRIRNTLLLAIGLSGSLLLGTIAGANVQPAATSTADVKAAAQTATAPNTAGKQDSGHNRAHPSERDQGLDRKDVGPFNRGPLVTVSPFCSQVPGKAKHVPATSVPNYCHLVPIVGTRRMQEASLYGAHHDGERSTPDESREHGSVIPIIRGEWVLAILSARRVLGLRPEANEVHHIELAPVIVLRKLPKPIQH